MAGYSDAALSVFRTVPRDQVTVTDVVRLAVRIPAGKSGRWYMASEADASAIGREFGWENVAVIEGAAS